MILRHYSNYKTSPNIDEVNQSYDYEVFKKPPEWEYVQRLLPFQAIPKVTPKDKYPSGWVPPKEEAVNNPYFISRTKNGELPIYLEITHRGMRRVSKLKKIDGDLWLMNDDIREFLKSKHNRFVMTRVHEFAKFIEVKGDFVNDLKDWALSKGF